MARRLGGDLAGARAVLAALAASQPRSSETRYQLGLVLAEAGDAPAAVSAFRQALRLDPRRSEAWRALGDLLTLAGDAAGADEAYAEHIRTSVNDPALMEAAVALCEDQLAVAERLLKAHLADAPTDVVAIRMLAELAARLGRYGDAEALLRRALELAPSFHPARHNLAVVLYRQSKAEEVLPELDRLLELEPRNPSFRNLKAAVLGLIGEYAEALALYEGVLKEQPAQPKVWMSYGHSLKTAGRQPDSVAAYRRSIALEPGLGEAYWSLANLKTFQFSDQELGGMGEQLSRTDISDSDRLHLHYALGKALEDRGDYSGAFENYDAGARIRRSQVGYDPDETSARVKRSKALFTADFFAERHGQGADAPDPIFIVGLPRSGSTLIEQILSSHSAVEGTMELPEVLAIAKDLNLRKRRTDIAQYPDSIAALDPNELEALGRRFLERTRIYRKTDKPLFIDKMPNNWAHVGLLRAILPNAKIVDARRHPMGVGFSAFKQHFARGQNFSYDLGEIGRYYSDYVELMAHFDEVQPGRIHRVIYENMVSDTEAEVRRLLDYCGLQFEPACLRFYENERAVRTASSEQVRRPIYSESVEHWRNFERWLNPLKAALGPVLDHYPNPPNFEAVSSQTDPIGSQGQPRPTKEGVNR